MTTLPQRVARHARCIERPSGGAPFEVLGAVARGRPGYLAAATGVTVLALMSAVFAAFLLASIDSPRLLTIHAGYYVWLASIVITLLDLILIPRRRD